MAGIVGAGCRTLRDFACGSSTASFEAVDYVVGGASLAPQWALETFSIGRISDEGRDELALTLPEWGPLTILIRPSAVAVVDVCYHWLRGSVHLRRVGVLRQVGVLALAEGRMAQEC